MKKELSTWMQKVKSTDGKVSLNLVKESRFKGNRLKRFAHSMATLVQLNAEPLKHTAALFSD